MPAYPVGAIFGGIVPDGHWAGSPALVIRLMEHPDTEPRSPDEGLDGAFPLLEWDFDSRHAVSINTLLARRAASGPHFAMVGSATLSVMACSYREPHVIIVGREPGRHDIAPLVDRLVRAGRSVQVETTGRAATPVDHAWVTLRALPSQQPNLILPEAAERANEVLACIRWRADLDRAEALFADRRVPVWLRPSMFAAPGIYRQCLATAMRHAGWRINKLPQIPAAMEA